MKYTNLIAGSYTSAEHPYGISLLQINQKQLSLSDRLNAGKHPSFLISDGNERFYIANEINSSCNIGIYALSPDGIRPQGQMSSEGQGACHLSYDQATGLLFASCYGSGHIVCFDTKERRVKCSFRSEDNEGSHAHGTTIAFDGKWLLAVDLGKDLIDAFRMEDIMEGRMKPVSSLTLPASTGPRQILADSLGNRLYSINELDSSIYVIEFDKGSGAMTPRQKIAATATGKENYPGTAVLTKNGSHLLLPNRGANTISVFETEGATLSLKGEYSCFGDWPRYLNLTEDEEHLLVANQRSGELVLFLWRAESQKPLTYLDRIRIPEVSCVIDRQRI